MFIRRTQTRPSANGAPYFTYRLVRSERVGGKVRQVTLINLGRHFSLEQDFWPAFCLHIAALLAPQSSPLPVDAPPEVALLAQRYAAQIKPLSEVGTGRIGAVRGRFRDATQLSDAPVAGGVRADNPQQVAIDFDAPVLPIAAVPVPAVAEPDWVDAATLNVLDARSIGIEALGLHALRSLGVIEQLRDGGLNRVSVAAAIGQIVARMARPGSERATHRWLTRSSALGELIDFDFAKLSLTRLYQAGDALWRQHEALEAALYTRLDSLFGLHSTVALYDLTNTYFEGVAAGNPQAKRGHSKEKRSDAPLLTLGLVLDGEGFVRRSQVFAGNVHEASSLKEMLSGLDAPAGAMVVLDRGIVTHDNLRWLRDKGYRYLVMSRERRPIASAQVLATANGDSVRIERVVDAGEDADGDVRLLCYSEKRAAKEAAITTLQRQRFEAGLQTIVASLSKPKTRKKPEVIHQRIGRLKEAYASVAQHYQIDVSEAPSATSSQALDSASSASSASAAQSTVTHIRWTFDPAAHSKAMLAGHYVIRSNDLSLSAEELWRHYIQLTELEAVFRSLKSELGLRPIHHQLENRCKAHLWISVLAYQCVMFLRRNLKAHGINLSWQSIRTQMESQRRITATFAAKAGGTLHIRKTSQPEPEAKAIYAALGLNNQPGAIRRRHFRPERDL